jgi:hypothetical protein
MVSGGGGGGVLSPTWKLTPFWPSFLFLDFLFLTTLFADEEKTSGGGENSILGNGDGDLSTGGGDGGGERGSSATRLCSSSHNANW